MTRRLRAWGTQDTRVGAWFHRAGPGAFVFGVNGRPMRPNYSRPRVWRPAVAASGIAEPLPTPHSLRHTAVAHWIAAGIEPYKLAKWARHPSVATIYRIYCHLLDTDAVDGLVEHLDRFNAKERHWLLQTALGSPRLSDAFCEEIEAVTDVSVPVDAHYAMDHRDRRRLAFGARIHRPVPIRLRRWLRRRPLCRANRREDRS